MNEYSLTIILPKSWKTFYHYGNERPLHEELTERENEILLLIAKVHSNQEIADELFIVIKTVKTHVSHILFKLDVQDQTQAVVYAFQQG